MPRTQTTQEQRETMGAREHASELGLRFLGFGSDLVSTYPHRLPPGYYTDHDCFHDEAVYRGAVLLLTRGRCLPAVYDTMGERFLDLDRSQAPLDPLADGEQDAISAARMADSTAEHAAEEAREWDRAHYLRDFLMPQLCDEISEDRRDAARLQRKGEPSYAALARAKVRLSISQLREARDELRFLPETE